MEGLDAAILSHPLRICVPYDVVDFLMMVAAYVDAILCPELSVPTQQIAILLPSTEGEVPYEGVFSTAMVAIRRLALAIRLGASSVCLYFVEV